MQSTQSNPQAVDSPGDPARLHAHRWGVTRVTRTAAFALLVFTVMALTPGGARADITYTFDSSLGVSGSITTDGQTGSLSTSDILNWVINLRKGELSGSGAAIAVGVSATSSALLFDLTSASSALRLQQDSKNFLDLTAGTTGAPAQPYLFKGAVDTGSGGVSTNSNFSRSEDVPTLAIASASAPEPSTAALAVLGAVAFIAHGWIRHRRNQRRQGAA